MKREPMFCFETAIKLYYFSHIIYYYEKVSTRVPSYLCCMLPAHHRGSRYTGMLG
jgi:hypothetical protein